jgi:hypothetical protein
VGEIGVAFAYLMVRTVDVWLLHSAMRAVGQHVLSARVIMVAIAWGGASLAAWLQLIVVCCVCGLLLVVLLWRWELTQTFNEPSQAMAV